MRRDPVEDVVDRVRGVYSRWRRDTPVSQMRADWDQLFASPVSATIEPIHAGTVACHWVRPAGARRDAAIVYLHGGGFRVGSLMSHREIIARLAAEAGIQVLAVNYRLAPEHLLPAALEDAIAVVEWLEKSGFPSDRIAMAGDSAGAALALGTMITRLQEGKASPAAAYLMSAWTDLTASGESYQSRAALDPIHQRPMILAMARGALGPGMTADDPRLSPLLASADIMRALPPMLMQVGERETLVSDTEDFAARAGVAGASVRSEIWPGMIHVFQQFPDDLPEAREAVTAGGRFIATHIEGARTGSRHMSTNDDLHHYDAVVIGAGAGGMTAAARLVAAGHKTLLVERLGRLGGRASSEQIDGHIVNIGAIAIELGGVFEETFALLGVPLDLREPKPATVFYLDGKIINAAKGGWGMLLGAFTKQAAKIGAKFADARNGDLPEAELSTAEWLSSYTSNATVHAIFRNLCAAIFAANADELPARAFLTYFAVKGAFKRFGFCPRGTIGIWNDLGDGIRRAGGDIWLNSSVSGLQVEGDRVIGLDVERDGARLRVSAKTVISNIGPAATAALPGAEAFGENYIDQTRTKMRSSANIVINFATRKRLIDAPGLVTFGATQRLCNMGELTASCPELAPPGWYQYVAYAVPKPAIGDFDEKTEIEASLADLRSLFSDFADAKMLSIRVMRNDWPAQRSCAGFDLPQDTPLANLWHVGDAVKDYGDGGTQACAYTAREAVKKVVVLLGTGAA